VAPGVSPALDSLRAIRGASLTVSLFTYGPSDVFYERFGHAALAVRDSLTGEDVAYNWASSILTSRIFWSIPDWRYRVFDGWVSDRVVQRAVRVITADSPSGPRRRRSSVRRCSSSCSGMRATHRTTATTTIARTARPARRPRSRARAIAAGAECAWHRPHVARRNRAPDAAVLCGHPGGAWATQTTHSRSGTRAYVWQRTSPRRAARCQRREYRLVTHDTTLFIVTHPAANGGSGALGDGRTARARWRVSSRGRCARRARRAWPSR
jgi:hypothetical protein